MQEINSHKSTKMRLGVAGAALCASFLLSTNLDNHTVKADTVTGNEETEQETKQAQHPDIPVQVVGGEETNSTNDATVNHDANQTPTRQNTTKPTNTALNQADKADKTVQTGANNTSEQVDKADTNAASDNHPSQPTIVKNGSRATKSKLTGRKIKTKKDTSDATWDNVQADYDIANHSLTIKGGKLFNPNPIYKQFTDSEKALQTIKITGQVNASGSIAKLFANLANVTTIEGLNNINVNSVTGMNYLFDGDKSLTSLDLTSWAPQNTTDMNHMFSNCTNLETVYLTKNTSDENGTPWFNTRKVTNMSAMFKNNKKLYYIGEPNNINKDGDVQFDFACDNVTDMSQMFQGCSSIKSIMFYADSNLQNVKNMNSMLADCVNLEHIYGNASLQSVADLSYFAANDYNLLSYGLVVDQYGATPHDVTASHMFYNDYQLNEVYPWYLYNLVDASYMFANNKSLDYSLQTFLNELGGASNGTSYISKLTNMAHMLDGCTSLSQLDLTLFTTNDNLKANKDGMFRNLTNLKQITLGKGVNLDGTGFMPPFEYTAVADGTVNKPNGKTYTATGLRKFWNKQTGTETFVGTPAKYYNVTVNYVDAKTKKILKTTTKVGNSKDPIEFGKEFKDTLATLTENGVYTYDSKNSTVPLDKNDDIQLPDTVNSDVTYEVVLIPRTETTGNSDTIVTNVIVHYHDEFGNKLLPDETITGKLGGSWNAVPKEIKGYHLIRTDGMATGTISDVRQEVTFVYAKDQPAEPNKPAKPDQKPNKKPSKPNINKPNKPTIIDHGTTYQPSANAVSDVIGKPTVIKTAQASSVDGKDMANSNLPQTGVNAKKNTNMFIAGISAILIALLGTFGFMRKKKNK